MWACAVVGFHLSPQDAWEITFPELRFLFEWQSKPHKNFSGSAMSIEDLDEMEQRMLHREIANG